MTPITIRAAIDSDIAELSAVAFRAKAHWGYSQSFMDACVDELTVTSDQINSPGTHYVVAELEEKIVGFYAVDHVENTEYELDALFVDSNHIGTGIGRRLMDHAKTTVCELGGRTLMIQSDPHAAEFYRAAGGEMISERESGSIPGRMLPVFKITLDGRKNV